MRSQKCPLTFSQLYARKHLLVIVLYEICNDQINIESNNKLALYYVGKRLPTPIICYACDI